MWQFICDRTMVWEVEKQCDFILCKAKFCCITVSLCWPFHHAGAAAGCLEKGRGVRGGEWPLGGLNKLLLKAPRAGSHSLWAREEFPHWLHWGQSVPARAACWTRTDSAGPANGRVCLLLTAQAATRFCSPAARQELYKRYFEKDRQQHLKGWTKFPAGAVLLE